MSGLRYEEAGAGKPPVATERVGDDHYQLLKLVDPTPGSTTPIGTTANPMKVSGTVTASGPLTDAQLREVTPDLVGTWGYHAGISGTEVIPAGQRVIGIAAHATVAGSMTINGGDSVPIPAQSGIAIQPVGQLVAPTLVFTSTDGYFVETLS